MAAGTSSRGAAEGGTKAGTKRFTADGKPLKGLIAAKPARDAGPGRGPAHGHLCRATARVARLGRRVLWFVLGCRAVRPVQCSRLFEELPQLFTSRQWQEGPYMYQCIPRSAATRPSALASDPRWNTRTSGGASATRGRGRTPWDSRPWWRSARRCPVPTRPAPRTFTAPMSCDASYKCRQTRLARPRYHGAARCARGGGRGGGEGRQLEAEQRLAEEGKMPASRRSPGNGRRVRLAQSHGFRREHPRGRGPKRHGPRAPRGAATGRNDWRSSNASSRRRRRRSAATSRSPRAWAARWVKTPCASRTSSACPGKRYEATSATWRGSCRASRSRVARLARAPVGQVQGQVSSRVVNFHFLFEQRGGGRTQRRRQARKGLARGGGDAFQG